MKRIVALLSIVGLSWLSQPAIAQQLFRGDARCFLRNEDVDEDELEDCDVLIEGGNIVIDYDDGDWTDVSIPLDRIVGMTTQTYTLSRKFGSDAERRRTGIAIDHLTADNQFLVTVFEFRSRTGFVFVHILREQSQLRSGAEFSR